MHTLDYWEQRVDGGPYFDPIQVPHNTMNGVLDEAEYLNTKSGISTSSRSLYG